MERAAKILFTAVTAAALYRIIAMWWEIAEERLYGWSQVSMVDDLAAVTIALIAAAALSTWGWRE